MNVMIDKFGKDVWTSKVDKDHFTVTVPVALSPQFYGWVAGLGEQIEIMEPVEIRDKYMEHIAKIVQKYQ